MNRYPKTLNLKLSRTQHTALTELVSLLHAPSKSSAARRAIVEARNRYRDELTREPDRVIDRVERMA